MGVILSVRMYRRFCQEELYEKMKTVMRSILKSLKKFFEKIEKVQLENPPSCGG